MCCCCYSKCVLYLLSGCNISCMTVVLMIYSITSKRSEKKGLHHNISLTFCLPTLPVLFRACSIKWDRNYKKIHLCSFAEVLKGQFTPKIKNTYFPSYLCVLFIDVDSFGVSCLVSEISTVEISAFSLL